MIELRDPDDAKSCNCCPSMDAAIKVCFVSPGPPASSTNIRLCKKCFTELRRTVTGYERR